MVQKPWQTKEWKIKRQKYLLNKVCEWCGCSENLLIHHKRRMIPYFSHLKLRGNEKLKEEITKGNYSTLKIEVITCPNCHTHRPSDIYKRKTMLPQYRCKNCGCEFNEPLKGIRDTDRLSKKDWDVFWELNKDKIKEQVANERSQFYESYLNFDNCIVLCKRCHYALHRGYKLCPICKKNYCRTRYSSCLACKTNESIINLFSFSGA